MVKALLSFLLATVLSFAALGQQPAAVSSSLVRHVRISLLTVGQGEMVWEAFGHSCLRVIDSSRSGQARDLVYNYGTFDAFGQDFAGKMIDGTLLYYLSVFPYDFFITKFVEKGRSIDEQVFLLNDKQRTDLANNLDVNALPANKYYPYSFFTDNCTTRIFEMISKTFGTKFVPGPVLPADSDISFYEGSYQYYAQRHWERVGVALMFENRMRRPMNDPELMFLPYYLSKAIDGATISGGKFSDSKTIVVPDTMPHRQVPNGPLILSSLIALLTILGLSVSKLRVLGKIMSWVVMLISGTLGCIILYAWFGTGHIGCENNLNILWALPTNLIILLLKPRVRASYAIVALVLQGLCILLYMFRVMVMPLPELTPFLLAMVWVYALMYRQGKKNKILSAHR